MEVRNYTLSLKEHDGRYTQASYADCPCRWCYRPHDCGSTHSYYGHQVRMECVERYNNGCPSPKPEPEHVYTSTRGKVCRRCHTRR
jgi:hypothetical protein